MKVILLMSLLLLFGLANSAKADVYTLSRLKSFVAKSDSCLLAIAYTLAKDGKDDDKVWSNRVICVTQLSAGSGTIRQAEGCALGVFDAETGNILSTYDLSQDHMLKKHWSGFAMVEKKCNEGGLDDLLKVKAGASWGTVRQAIFQGPFLGNDWAIANGSGYPKTRFLYAGHPDWEAWWKEEEAKFKTVTSDEPENKNCVQTKKGKRCKKSAK